MLEILRLEGTAMRVARLENTILKVYVSRMIAVAVLSLLVTTAGLGQEALHNQATHFKELPNFQKVNENLYRGGQPRAGGVKKLSELGIKTIVNLRGTDEMTRTEQEEARAAGLTYFNVSMPGLSRPTNEQLSRVMGILDAPENWPVFVHCRRGSDRTGTVVAVYRITKEQWTASQAITEAKRYGMSWVQFRMKDYVSDFYRDRNADKKGPAEKAANQPIKQNDK
jgi:protein tyrosine/serine phosphatase